MVHLEDRGGGEAVVLLHGTPTAPSHLRPLAERLAKRWRTLLVHGPGVSASPPLRPYDLDASNAAIEEALLARGVTEARFVGMSGGTHRAIAIASARRVKAKSVAMLGPILSFDPEKAQGLRDFASALRQGAPGLEAALVDLILAPASRAVPALVAEVEGWLTAYATPADLAAELEAFADHGRDLRAEAAALDVPVLLRVGAEDRATVPALAEELARIVPRSVLQIVPGVGHALASEDAAATEQAVEGFFARSP